MDNTDLVLGTDSIASCKFNYHTITTTTYPYYIYIYISLMRVRRGRDCMVVEFTNSYGIRAQHHWSSNPDQARCTQYNIVW
jgi:hypothetical protein